MSNEFDVRKDTSAEPDTIRFAEEDDHDCTIATKLCKDGINDVDDGKDVWYVAIAEESYENQDRAGSCYVLIGSKEHAHNLMKALQKAIDLGWWG